MMFMILTGSTAFSQILAFTGASRGLVEFVVSFEFPHLIIVLVMQALIVILGTFMESVSIMMITFPIFMPLIRALEFDPIWFGLLVLINMEVGMKTPPFGLCLFVMRGVVQAGNVHDGYLQVGYSFYRHRPDSHAVDHVFPFHSDVFAGLYEILAGVCERWLNFCLRNCPDMK
jgi:TRAP-type mannitol/chloroaromatic compound transport system permease large subunit